MTSGRFSSRDLNRSQLPSGYGRPLPALSPCHTLDLRGTYWPNAAWYAHCLFERRHPTTWLLEVRMLNIAVRGGIVFG